MQEPVVLGLGEAAALLADPAQFEQLGDLTGPGVLAVELGPAADAAAGPLLARVPCVTIGLLDTAGPGRPAHDPGLLDAFDVLLAAPGPHRPPAGAVADDAPTTALAELAAAVSDRPRASRVLVQVLRASSTLDVADGLVLESLAYSTLQAGPEFAAWRGTASARPPRPGNGPPVLLRRRGSALHVVFNRPEVHNAFSSAMRDGLIEGLQLAVLDRSIDEVHLSGSPPTFCSGGDLAEFGTFGDPATAHGIRTARSPGRLLAGLEAEGWSCTRGVTAGGPGPNWRPSPTRCGSPRERPSACPRWPSA